MNKVFIIAEAGVNHNGSIELAKKLIDAAVDAGADSVKFQTFKATNLASKNTEKADYQKAPHPFPRSEQNLKALVTLSGATCRCEFGESLILLKEII